MNIFKLIFPIYESFELLFCYDDDIVKNNWELAKELEGKPPMSAQDVKNYVKFKNNNKMGF
jgi:hypothetical protein